MYSDLVSNGKYRPPPPKIVSSLAVPKLDKPKSQTYHIYKSGIVPSIIYIVPTFIRFSKTV